MGGSPLPLMADNIPKRSYTEMGEQNSPRLSFRQRIPQTRKTQTGDFPVFHVWHRVGNFRQKNSFAEGGIDITNCLFRRNSSCSAEQKILGIPFRTVPQRRKILEILYHGTKLEANARNSVLNHSAEEKPIRNFVLWNKNISKHLEFCSEPFRGRDNNLKFRSEACLGRKHAVNFVCWSRIFCKTNFFHAISFRSELRNRLFSKSRNASELAFFPQNNGSCSECIPPQRRKTLDG